MHHLPLAQQSSETDAKFILKLYESRLKKYYELISARNAEEISPIVNPDILKFIKEFTARVQQTGSSDSQMPKVSALKVPLTPSQFMSPAQALISMLYL